MNQNRFLYLLVFVVGTGSLGAEIAVARLMAPFFGASTIVWANTIGVVLVALSIGYWFGGRLADRDPSLRALCKIVLAAAVLLAIVPFLARPFFDVSVDALDSISAGAFAGSLLAVLVLVAVPVMLLGAASPYALRLAVPDVEHAGRVSGRLYAISTAGSLTGTMVSSLVLIPFLGTQRTFLVFALVIGATAVAGIGIRFAPVAALIAAALAIPVGTVKSSSSGEVIYETETETQYAQVVEEPDGERSLELNEGQAVHSLYKPGTYLTGRYWDGLIVLPFAALDHPPARVAILGNAAGTAARMYGHYFPKARVDGVEIDGELTDIGRRVLRPDGPRSAHLHRRCQALAAAVGRRLRRDRRRRVSPALHPLLPGHQGVLRVGSRPPCTRRRRRRQHRPSRRQRRSREGGRGDDGVGVPDRDPRSARDGQHAAARQHRAGVVGAAAGVGRAAPRRSQEPGGRRIGRGSRRC